MRTFRLNMKGFYAGQPHTCPRFVRGDMVRSHSLAALYIFSKMSRKERGASWAPGVTPSATDPAFLGSCVEPAPHQVCFPD